MPDLEELTPSWGAAERSRDDRAEGAAVPAETNDPSPSSPRESPDALRMGGLEVTNASERLREIDAARGRDRRPALADATAEPSSSGAHALESPHGKQKNAWLTKRARRRRSADGGSRAVGSPRDDTTWGTPDLARGTSHANTDVRVDGNEGAGFGTPRGLRGRGYDRTDARSAKADLDAPMDQWLRHTVERMPVRPDRVSGVLGPLMNVAQVDNKTVDVTMTTSFRAHFAQPIAELAAAGNQGLTTDAASAGAPALELPAPGDAAPAFGESHDAVSPGLPFGGEARGGALVLGGGGGVTPGADGGRFGVARLDDYVADAGGARRASSPLMLGAADAAAGVRAAAEWTIAPAELRLRERVAVGGFAEVFRGTWNGTTVAVKQLLERGPDVVDRLREEVLTLCRLRHPNLLLFMGWCADPPLIATEFMRRGSLHSILRGNGGHLGAPRTHHAAVSVAKGMQYLHSRAPPILHLDLKSPNILVDDKWRVKIADFGLARARRNTLVSGRSGFHGTPEWMAPEMLRAEDYDEKADSYSYGVVLWELLAAQTPWNELHPMQVVAVVGYSDRRLTLPPEARDFAGENLVTRALADLFWECASKSPIARPGFDEILERLERAPGMLLPGPEPDPSATTQTPPRRAAVQHIAKRVSSKRAEAPVSGTAAEPRKGDAPRPASADRALGARVKGAGLAWTAAGVEIEEITDHEDAPSKREAVAAEPTTTRPREYYLVQEDEEA